MQQRIAVIVTATLISAMLAGPILARVPNRPAQTKDYLSEEEADKWYDDHSAGRRPPEHGDGGAHHQGAARRLRGGSAEQVRV